MIGETVDSRALSRLSREELVERVVQLSEQVRLLNERLEEQQVTDSLTGLANRDYFFASLTWLWKRARRFEQQVCVALIDIDGFRVINDRYGHLGGDLVLRGVAEALRTTVRDYDLLARYADEEFAVAIDNATAPLADRLGRRIREAITRAPFCLDERAIPVTVTVGLAVGKPTDDEGKLKDLVTSAIQAVGLARQRGPNQQHVLPVRAADGWNA